MSAARWWWCTAPHPGAIAVACVHGAPAEIDSISHALTGQRAPSIGALAWRALAAIDDGVVARTSADTLLVMPHGGPRIRAHLDQAFERHGLQGGQVPAADAATAAEAARATYPEAADALEALALEALATATSPRAVDLLLAQPARWRAALRRSEAPWQGDPCAGLAVARTTAHDSTHAPALARLLRPARVFVTGPANAGKSTLMNALAGRSVAVAHDEPGTTRDAVAVRLDLDGVVVDWFDTPGVRENPTAAEIDAQRTAARLLEHADVVVRLTAPRLGWHALATSPSPAHAPALHVLNKSDDAACAACDERQRADLRVSALRGDGLADLALRVRALLVPDSALSSPVPWAFCAALRDGAFLDRLQRDLAPDDSAAKGASANLSRP